jgi:iron only hydrogenase large subunit-like protein
MNEPTKLIELINQKTKLVAMLAPSFPIMYDYPKIISKLRNLGFTYVVEVSVGAKKTNEELAVLLKQNPTSRYITSPCPTIVRMIKKQMPQYAKYFTHDVDSPMIATAKIVRKKYPDYKPVFIGPCIVKKLEASEDVPELNILVLTYAEINQIFDNFKTPDQFNPDDKFDISEPGMTRIYPVDGGLSHSSGLEKHFSKEELQIVSGWKNCIEAVKNFDTNPKIRLLDILFCDNGCINGPGIISQLKIEERKKKVLDFSQK